MADYTSSNTGAAIDGAVDYVELLDNIVTVDSGNNRIGINNGSPASALDVTGSVTASGNIIPTGGSATAGSIWKSGANLLISMDTGGLYVNNSADTITALQITDAGNVGIGAVPSASSATTNIELPYGATLSSRSNTTAPQFAMMSNAVGNWYEPTYKIDGFATQYVQQGNDGTHAWSTAASGTAGNAITFTPRMTLDASGNLLVGKTSSGTANTGAELRNGSSNHAVIATSTSATPLVVNRKTNDGPLVTLYKDSATVGSIGSYLGSGTSQFFIAGADTGFKINSSVDVIAPSDGSGGTRDAAIDLGDAGGRFKDLYLSGNATLGSGFNLSWGGAYSAGKPTISGSTDKLVFYPEGNVSNEKMRLDSSGNLLVGTTSTINSGLGVFSKANSNQLVINSSNSNGGSLDFCNGGASASARIGGLTTGTATALQVQVGATGGVQLASGATSWTSMSDERLKDIIEPISDAVRKLLTLRTVIGKYKVDAPQVRRVFVIAQDVEKVLPEAVSKSTVSLDDPEEFLGVAYSELIPLLIAGFKEQQATIEALTARIAALES